MKEKYLNALGLELKLHRVKKQLSQEQLADLSNLDRTYIGGIERGERNPTIITLLSICNALDVSIIEIFENIKKGE